MSSFNILQKAVETAAKAEKASHETMLSWAKLAQKADEAIIRVHDAEQTGDAEAIRFARRVARAAAAAEKAAHTIGSQSLRDAAMAKMVFQTALAMARGSMPTSKILLVETTNKKTEEFFRQNDEEFFVNYEAHRLIAISAKDGRIYKSSRCVRRSLDGATVWVVTNNTKLVING